MDIKKLSIDDILTKLGDRLHILVEVDLQLSVPLETKNFDKVVTYIGNTIIECVTMQHGSTAVEVGFLVQGFTAINFHQD